MTAQELAFGGEEEFAADRNGAYAILTDLNELPRLIPDLVSWERPSDNTLVCIVRPGFSFLRGTLKLTIQLIDYTPPRTAALAVAASGIGSSLSAVTRLEADEIGDHTRIRWTARVERLEGLLTSVSKALVSAAASRVIQTAWSRFRERLEEHHDRGPATVNEPAAPS